MLDAALTGPAGLVATGVAVAPAPTGVMAPREAVATGLPGRPPGGSVAPEGTPVATGVPGSATAGEGVAAWIWSGAATSDGVTRWAIGEGCGPCPATGWLALSASSAMTPMKPVVSHCTGRLPNRLPRPIPTEASRDAPVSIGSPTHRPAATSAVNPLDAGDRLVAELERVPW